MYKDVIPLLACPSCKTSLALEDADASSSDDIDSGRLNCQSEHSWMIEDGVLTITREDAPSDPWSRSFANYAKFVRNKAYGMANFLEEARPVADTVAAQAERSHLDLCTGDGVLLYSLLDRLAPDVSVVSVDHSLHAQKYNRRYLKERAESRGVSFVAADAAEMPLADGVFQTVGALGIGNMLGKMADGIREGVRVLSEGGSFAFAHMYVDEDSEGWRRSSAGLRELSDESDIGYHGLENDFLVFMETVSPGKFVVEKVREVVGEAGRDVEAGPTFPYPNERLTELLVKVCK